MRSILCCFLFLFGCSIARGQQIKPSAFFVEDTMALAQPVQFSLAVEYPSELTVLFPDSTFNYAPFEFRSKHFFTTKTDSLKSKDSVIYTLASFEIDQLQFLKLPIFVVNGADSLSILSNADSIIFAEMILVVSDSLEAQSDTYFVKVPKQFNYPYFIIGIVVLSLIVLAVAFIFGRRIVISWKIYRLRKKQQAFLASFNSTSKLESRVEIETLLVRWKKHAEYVGRKPFTKLTTKEVRILIADEQLNEALQQIDKAIYSSKGRAELNGSFEFLKEYTTTIFENRVKELQNDAKR